MSKSAPELPINTRERPTDVVPACAVWENVEDATRADGIELRERLIGLTGRLVEHGELTRRGADLSEAP